MPISSKIVCLTLLGLIGYIFGDQITLTATIRDVWPCNNNANCGNQAGNGPISSNATCNPNNCMRSFEEANYGSGGVDYGIVQTALGSDKKPRYNNKTSHPSIADGGENFDKWFNNYDGWNMAYAVNLTLDNSVCDPDASCNPYVFGYNNPGFWPINNRGWGNFRPSYPNQNFHFCMELHTKFSYQGNEMFTFTGDDDVWVFINNQLVVDIGGVHGATSAGVQLNQTNIGLVVGGIYNFDFFNCERHTSESNCKMWTSIALVCPTRDFCGICGGDGSSCCTCKDDDICTTDKCNATTGACIFTPITCGPAPDMCQQNICLNSTGGCNLQPVNCDDLNPCTNDTCDKTYGCKHIMKGCDDYNSCTMDYCNNATGQCVNSPIANCTKCSHATCDNSDYCNPQSCNEADGLCYPFVRNCDDGNACTVDGCANGTCYTVRPMICNDHNDCTSDVCNTTTGCPYNNITCDDGNACTQNLCNVTGGCWYPAVVMPAVANCKIAYCDEVQGITITDMTCQPTSKCSCNVNTNQCDCGNFFTNLSTPAKIGAGIIAAIVIGGVAALAIFIVGGKKGYDYYKSHQGSLGNVANNPLYEDNGMKGNNPLYEDTA